MRERDFRQLPGILLLFGFGGAVLYRRKANKGTGQVESAFEPRMWLDLNFADEGVPGEHSQSMRLFRPR